MLNEEQANKAGLLHKIQFAEVIILRLNQIITIKDILKGFYMLQISLKDLSMD